MKNNNPIVHVVAAVIRNAAGKILLAQRPLNNSHLPGYWEFPGGKIEPEESAEQALVRELQEEISITPTSFSPLIQVPYSYAEKDVLLDVWMVDEYVGEMQPLEGQETSWVAVDDLNQHQLPPADIPVITSLKLPQTYLITPEPADYDVDKFAQKLDLSLAAGISLVQLRSKRLVGDELLSYVESAKDVCRRHGAKLLINSEIELYKKCGLDGLHLNSGQLQVGIKKNSDTDLLAASCHSLQDIKNAEQSGVDFLLLSPVKKTATHPDAQPLGWEEFATIITQCSVPVFALGGLGWSDVEESKRYGAQGVAAIRGLWCESGV